MNKPLASNFSTSFKEEGEVLYVLQDENEIISDATFMDIYPVEKEEK